MVEGREGIENSLLLCVFRCADAVYFDSLSACPLLLEARLLEARAPWLHSSLF